MDQITKQHHRIINCRYTGKCPHHKTKQQLCQKRICIIEALSGVHFYGHTLIHCQHSRSIIPGNGDHFFSCTFRHLDRLQNRMLQIKPGNLLKLFHRTEALCLLLSFLQPVYPISTDIREIQISSPKGKIIRQKPGPVFRPVHHLKRILFKGIDRSVFDHKISAILIDGKILNLIRKIPVNIPVSFRICLSVFQDICTKALSIRIHRRKTNLILQGNK